MNILVIIIVLLFILNIISAYADEHVYISESQYFNVMEEDDIKYNLRSGVMRLEAR